MRRAPLVLGATIAGTAGVFAFAPSAPTAQSVVDATTSAAAIATTSATAAGSVTRTGTETTAATTTTVAAATSVGLSGTATGSAIATQYGSVQVRVTVKDDKVIAVQALQLTGPDPRSTQISAAAEPTLQQEALTAQSADIDSVSGATYTSAAYAQSLRSALEKLGFKAAATTLQVPA